MEYSCNLDDDVDDSNFHRHVGYEQNNGCIAQYFARQTIETISHKVTELLEGVDPQERMIVVPDDKIANVMSAIHDGYRHPVGDIFTRHHIVSGESPNYLQNMIDQVINVIVSDVKNTIDTQENNKKLTIWTTVLGDFNNEGLRAHSAIKIRNKHPAQMQFNMNY